MSDNKEQCRAEFEAWAITEDGGNWFACDPSIFNKREDGTYFDRGMQSEFAAWQAAWNRAAQPVVLTDEHVRAAGGIVHKDGNIFFTNIGKLNAAILAAKEQA